MGIAVPTVKESIHWNPRNKNLFFREYGMNKRALSSLWLLGIIVVVLAVACASAPVEEETSMIVALRGEATAETRTLSDLPDSLDATCFAGIPLIEVKTGKVIGTAEDCLSDINPVGEGMSITGTTFFNFQEGGTLISRGQTSVQPTTIGSDAFTHITGAIPSPGSNQVIGGTESYEDASATVRLSGAVNLSLLESDGKVTFDCMFEITLHNQ